MKIEVEVQKTSAEECPVSCHFRETHHGYSAPDYCSHWKKILKTDGEKGYGYIACSECAAEYRKQEEPKLTPPMICPKCKSERIFELVWKWRRVGNKTESLYMCYNCKHEFTKNEVTEPISDRDSAFVKKTRGGEGWQIKGVDVHETIERRTL